MKVKLSSNYTIRNQKNCSYIINVDKIVDKKTEAFGAITVPPFIGYILSRLGRNEFEKDLAEMSRESGISINALRKFVSQLLDNEEHKEFKLSEALSIVFPYQLLTVVDDDEKPLEYYETNDFNVMDEFIIQRPSMPLSANLMVTTKCNTSCCYCYANRQLKPLMTTAEILDVLKQLKEGGVVNLTLTGGDIFAHSDWKLILEEVIKAGFKPFLSTKTPLNESELAKLQEVGYTEIQFSLDSDEPEVLRRLIKVDDDYIVKVAEMFDKATGYGIDISIRSVITKLNGSIEDIKKLYAFLTRYRSVKSWTITPAFFSEYKKEQYNDIEADNEDLKAIYLFTHEDGLSIPIRLNKIESEGYKLRKCDTVEDFVCKNQICLANTISLSILANGKCSVCEMLYDHEQYILGDIRKDDIYSIWNSEKALDLYAPKQENVKPESPCRECKVFTECKKSFGKRICYLDITKMGGDKDDPDPRCPLSNKTERILL